MGRKPNTPEQNEASRERRRVYMREYKRKQYADSKNDISEVNKMQYLKSKLKDDDTIINELECVSVCKSDFGKILCLFKKIDSQHPGELKTFLQNYISSH